MKTTLSMYKNKLSFTIKIAYYVSDWAISCIGFHLTTKAFGIVYSW
jgi:hypothetical protein